MEIKPHERDLPVHDLADGIRSTPGQNGGTVLDINGNRIFRLNALGDLILQCVRQGWNEVRIATHISNHYAVNEDTARCDVREYLEILQKHRLIRTAKRVGRP